MINIRLEEIYSFNMFFFSTSSFLLVLICHVIFFPFGLILSVGK